jgi:uncharacterized protein (TIGR03083 family)
MTKTIGAHDWTALRHDEVRAAAAILRSLTEAQWDHPSLCTGWRVRDVIGHMVSGSEYGLKALPAKVIASRFSLDRAAARLAVEVADSRPAARLLEDWARYETAPKAQGFARTLEPRDVLLDHVVHTIDMLRPLGIERPASPVRLGAALDAAPHVAGGARSRRRTIGLRLVATDIDWAGGDGPEVRGTAEDLLLALCGRPAGLAGLSGAGVGELRRRVAA